MSERTEYNKIRDKLLQRNQLFEDPDFPATARSIREDGNVSPYIKWLRPKEIARDPKFIVKGATRFDLQQGELGDCWFIAGAALLASTSQPLLERLVPQDQDFDSKYAGIFRFNFWQYDEWVEIVVDDRIPTRNGYPIYAHNRTKGETNEFWVALLEKAYAKLYKSYDNIDGGQLGNALVDFTGGISERIELKNNRASLKPTLYELLTRTFRMNSMMGCSISGIAGRETEFANGLYGAHSYGIIKLANVEVFGSPVRLLKLRNPWGRGEWNGPWSDKSKEWNSVSLEEKKKIGLLPKDEGEFWMEYSDWLTEFENLDMTHLSPDALTQHVAEDMEKHGWKVAKYHGEWIKGINAGGCGNEPYADLLWINPQYSVTLTEADDVDDDGKTTMVVSLMQRHEDLANDLYISFYLFKLRESKPILLDGQNYDKYSLRLQAQPGTYINRREATGHYRLEPGTYVIMPTTFYPNKEGRFYLRIYTEKEAETSVVDEPTVIVTPEEEPDALLELFNKYSGVERRIDATDLQNILKELYKDDLQRGGFGIEVCRSLVALLDRDQSGLLDFEEFTKMIKELDVWKRAFSMFDANKSGDIDTTELSKLFEALGMKLSRQLTSAIIRRYSGKNRKLLFEDFIQVCAKIVVMYGEFSRRAGDATVSTAKIELSLEEWLATTLLY